MKKNIVTVVLGATFFSFIGCEKEYQRPKKYEIDLFKNEKDQAAQRYIMPQNVAYGSSDMVIASSDVSVLESFSNEGKKIYIYSVNSGNLLFSKRDSAIVYPFDFLSTQKLSFNVASSDSVYVFLERLHGYRMTAEENNLEYQWLRGAPVYHLEKRTK